MAFILRKIYENVDFFEEYKDPRMEDFPLVGSAVPVLAICGLYLLFVLKIGPEWMKERKPFNLRHIISLYNAFQVIFNLLIFLVGIRPYYLRKDFSLICQPVDFTINDSNMRILLKATYGYYLTKYLDLLDTIFFVLRKKDKQITFLHVYHHAGMICATYVFTKFLGGSHPTLVGVINSAVHIVMYSYYFVTSVRSDFKDKIWWKKQITRLQLLQFGYLQLHFLLPIIIKNCQFPMVVTVITLIQNCFMFFLFLDFYLKAYCRKTPHSLAKENKSF